MTRCGGWCQIIFFGSDGVDQFSAIPGEEWSEHNALYIRGKEYTL
jgi:hypothetical protein